MLHQSFQVRVASETKKIRPLIGSNDAVIYDVSNFPPFADPNVNSEGPTNGLSIRQLTIGRINVSSSMNFGQNHNINI